MPGSSARRRYLAVAEQILHAVAVGTLAPGDRLPDERALALQCEVSRPTVREALLALELSGVIEVRPGAGCFVTSPSSRPGPALALPVDAVPRQVLEVRALLEPAAARLCARDMSPRERAGLAGLVEKAAGHLHDASASSIDRFSECNQDFHRAIAVASGNSVLAELTHQLIDPVKHPLWTLVDSIAGRDDEVRARQLAEHREVLDAIVAGDPDLAADAMSRHLEAMFQRIFGAQRDSVRRAKPRTPGTRSARRH